MPNKLKRILCIIDRCEEVIIGTIRDISQHEYGDALYQKANHGDVSFIQAIDKRTQPQSADNAAAGGNADRSGGTGYSQILAEK